MLESAPKPRQGPAASPNAGPARLSAVDPADQGCCRSVAFAPRRRRPPGGPLMRQGWPALPWAPLQGDTPCSSCFAPVRSVTGGRSSTPWSEACPVPALCCPRRGRWRGFGAEWWSSGRVRRGGFAQSPRGRGGSAWRRPFRSRRRGNALSDRINSCERSTRAAFRSQACLHVNPGFPLYGFG
jgi:hypothetical protein